MGALRPSLLILGVLALTGCSADPVPSARADALARQAELAAAVAAKPGDWALHVQLAEAQLRVGNGVGAEATLRRALELGGSADRLRPLAARAVLTQNEDSRALALLNGGPIHPDVAGEAGHVAGLIHLSRGNITAARDGFDAAIRAKPRDSSLWVDVARFRDANADAAGARDAVDFAIELDAQNAAALAAKANLLRIQEGLAAALPWYERALQIDPDNVDALLDHAATLGDLGQYRAMLVQLRHAAKLAPRSPRPHYLQAVLAARSGDYLLARSLLQRTRGAMENEPGFILLSAIVELELDGAAVAAYQADRLLTLQPHNLVARRLLAAASWASGDRDGAAEVLAPLVARADADSWSLNLAARVAAERGDDAASAQLLRRAAALSRGDAAPFAEADAVGLRSREADANPLNPGLVIPAIRAEIARGETGTAMARAQRLLEANRGVADAQMLFGDTALAARQWRVAIRAYRDARALDAGVRTALRLANAQHLAGDPAGAAATILTLQRGNGASVVADRLSGHLAADLGQQANVVAWFDRVRRRIGNRDVVVLRELVRALAAEGKHDRADALAMLAVRLQPLNRDLLLLWADQRAELGKANDAADLRARAAQLQ
jgi:cellulose synthase operon protein C